jgi:hypothetical protein
MMARRHGFADFGAAERGSRLRPLKISRNRSDGSDNHM